MFSGLYKFSNFSIILFYSQQIYQFCSTTCLSSLK
ncbi:MAG: hypothetical protein IPI53_12880 [Saprospiraceae bacterium]|nr:hypothetical protein [Saprospiraceae bacterium]